ncbi:MAG: RNA-binding protein [Desulfurococcaceae archaeon]|jgi:small nuclear ribonucleoprotein|nr:RNA-binding protein [Desulfurococcaceae archaeon]
MSDTAQKLLQESIGNIVLVKLRGGKELRGRLKSFDQHLNLVIEDAEEVTPESSRRLGTVVIRGENVLLISPATG